MGDCETKISLYEKWLYHLEKIESDVLTYQQHDFGYVYDESVLADLERMRVDSLFDWETKIHVIRLLLPDIRELRVDVESEGFGDSMTRDEFTEKWNQIHRAYDVIVDTLIDRIEIAESLGDVDGALVAIIKREMSAYMCMQDMIGSVLIDLFYVKDVV